MTEGRLRVAAVIAGLGAGGAEAMLHRLFGRLSPSRYELLVVSLTGRGLAAGPLEEAGVPVVTAGGGRDLRAVPGFVRLVRSLRRFRPHVVHTWMYHADLAGVLAAKLAGGPPAIWSVRHGSPTDPDLALPTRAVARLCARLSSRLPWRVVCNSRTALEGHARHGYDRDRMLVIPNGFDTARFHPRPGDRRPVRKELALPPDAEVVGMVAGYRPQKDHRTFVRAARHLARRRDGPVHFVLCGEGADATNPELRGWIGQAGLESRFHLLGLRDDVPRLMAALDIATLSSRSESFPTAVGEAMACGVPVVATDVGDAAEIVGDTGVVVDPGSPAALSDGWARLLEEGPDARRRRGEAARARVLERYRLEQVVARYEELYRAACAVRAPDFGPYEEGSARVRNSRRS